MAFGVQPLYGWAKRRRMKVLYFSPLENACTYYRCTLPARHLKRHGLAETRIVGTVSKEHLDWADIVIIQRSVGELMEKVSGYCRLMGKRVVYELDDNIFCYPDSIEYVKSGLQEQTVSAIKILRNCHAATVTTQTIADTIRELVDTPVYVLPNCLDFEDIKGMRIQHRSLGTYPLPLLLEGKAGGCVTSPLERGGGGCVIGWAGGHYHVQDLRLIEPALLQIMTRHPEVSAVFYGDCPKTLYDTFPGRVFFQPWTGLEDFYWQMSILRFDIGLAPLFRTGFARSRSPLRLLQYAALGIPIIGSNYGEYGRMLNNGMPGVQVQDGGLPGEAARAWADRVSWMIEHPEERRAMAERAKEYVRENFDIGKNVHKWMEVYQGVGV